MFEQMSKTASAQSPSPPPPSNPDIKLTDQQHLEEKLKSQFQGLSEDLSKQTGEAKSAFQRMKETYQTLHEMDFQAAFKPKAKEQGPEESQTKAEEAKAPEGTGKKGWTMPKVPVVNIPQPIKVYSKVAKTYVLEALRETFPTAEYKLEKEVKRQQKMAAEKEFMEKFERGEIAGDDDKIPDWKKGALQPVIVKKSIFQQAREKVQASVFGSKLEESAKKVVESPHLKSASAGLSNLKAGLDDLKDGIREDLDAADNKVINKVRDKLADITLETEEAKAAKSLKAYNQEFDVFSLEDQMEGLVEDVLRHFDARDLKTLKGLTEGQALHYFTQELSLPSDVSVI